MLKQEELTSKTITACLRFCCINNKEIISQFIESLFRHKLLDLPEESLHLFESITKRDYYFLSLSNLFEKLSSEDCSNVKIK